MNKNTLMVVGGIVFGLVGLYFIASEAVPRVMVTMTRAAPEKNIDLQSSHIIGEKLLARADGKEACVINVFIMDKNGMGVAGKRVELTGAKEAKTLNEITDKNGKVSYQVTSAIEGQFKLSASVEGVPMGKELTVTFRD